MRKLAPVFVLTSIVALTSGSALALGDRNKEKKSPNADTTATQSSTYGSPSGSASSASNPSGSASGMSGTASGSATGSTYGSGSTASTNGQAKADSTHGATVSGTARDKPTDGSTVSSVAKSNKEACKGLAKSDPAYSANECDKLMRKDKQASAGSTSSSGSVK